MNKTLPFLILNVFLLIQRIQGKSIKTKGTETSNKYIDSRKVFNDAVIAKLLTLSEEPLKLGIKLIQNTFVENLDNGNLNSFLTDVLDDYRNLTNHNPENKIELFLRLSVAFDFYSGTISDQISGDINLLLRIQEALRKHDVKDVAIEFQKNYSEFLKWLSLEIDANSTKFTAEEQLQVNEFHNLCLQFQENPNYKRMPLVESIVARLKK